MEEDCPGDRGGEYRWDLRDGLRFATKKISGTHYCGVGISELAFLALKKIDRDAVERLEANYGEQYITQPKN